MQIRAWKLYVLGWVGLGGTTGVCGWCVFTTLVSYVFFITTFVWGVQLKVAKGDKVNWDSDQCPTPQQQVISCVLFQSVFVQNVLFPKCRFSKVYFSKMCFSNGAMSEWWCHLLSCPSLLRGRAKKQHETQSCFLSLCWRHVDIYKLQRWETKSQKGHRTPSVCNFETFWEPSLGV